MKNNKLAIAAIVLSLVSLSSSAFIIGNVSNLERHQGYQDEQRTDAAKLIVATMNFAEDTREKAFVNALNIALVDKQLQASRCKYHRQCNAVIETRERAERERARLKEYRNNINK